MPQTTFETALRYLFPGLILFVYLENSEFGRIFPGVKNLSDRVVISAIIGVVFYSVYRAVVYDFVLAPILDLWARTTRLNTYRVWLEERYGIRRGDAEILYAAIRSTVPGLDTQNVGHRSALIHFMFQVSILSLLACVIQTTEGSASPINSIVVLGISLVLFLAAFAADIRIDRQMRMVLALNSKQVDKAAESAGFAPTRRPPVRNKASRAKVDRKR